MNARVSGLSSRLISMLVVALVLNAVVALPGPLAPAAHAAAGLATRAMGACSSEPATPAHYRFVVDLDYARHTALVTQTVEVTNNSSDTWTRIVLQIASARRAGVFTLSSLAVAGTAAAYSVDRQSYTYAITLPQQLTSCAGTSLTLVYRLNVPATSLGGGFPYGNLGYGGRVIQFGNWYPVLVPYRDGQGWYTWKWVEIGDPWVSEVAEYDLEVRADASVVVAGSGPLGSSAGAWRFHLNHARGIAFTASPEYQRQAGVVDGVAVYSYYLADHPRAGTDVLTATLQCISLFNRLYGPYPYPSFTIAENAYAGSMEYSGFVSHSGAKYASYSGQPSAMLINYVAHEVAHQWWYSVVGSDQVYEPWLDEALAVYSEVEFYRAYHPELEAWSLSRFGSPRYHGALDRATYQYPGAQAYVDEFYDLSGQFMMVVHDGLGADHYYAFLRQWRAQGEYRLATAQTFFALYGAYAPGECATNVAAYFPTMAARAGGAAILCGAQPAG